MRLDVGIEIVGDKVVVAMLGDRVDDCREGVCVAEGVGADGVEDGGQRRVKGDA